MQCVIRIICGILSCFLGYETTVSSNLNNADVGGRPLRIDPFLKGKTTVTVRGELIDGGFLVFWVLQNVVHNGAETEAFLPPSIKVLLHRSLIALAKCLYGSRSSHGIISSRPFGRCNPTIRIL
jgi:hypothetical protein